MAVRLLPNSTARGSAARATRRWSTVARTWSGKASRGGRPRRISPFGARVAMRCSVAAGHAGQCGIGEQGLVPLRRRRGLRAVGIAGDGWGCRA